MFVFALAVPCLASPPARVRTTAKESTCLQSSVPTYRKSDTYFRARLYSGEACVSRHDSRLVSWSSQVVKGWCNANRMGKSYGQFFTREETQNCQPISFKNKRMGILQDPGATGGQRKSDYLPRMVHVTETM
jgi:hypothetical protein